MPVTGRMDLVDEFLKLFPEIAGVADSGVTRDTRKALRRYAAGGLAEELAKARDTDTVRIGTMHRFKGLEFQRVFLEDVSEGQVPHQRIEAYRMASPDRYRQELQRARSLLFVAATRARDELVVTWNGKASRFLPERADQDAGNAVELLSGDGPPSGSAAA